MDEDSILCNNSLKWSVKFLLKEESMCPDLEAGNGIVSVNCFSYGIESLRIQCELDFKWHKW